MKFHCETLSEKFLRLSEWHVWFAWHPVRVGEGDCRWLEFVDRRCTGFGYGDFYYEHRPCA